MALPTGPIPRVAFDEIIEEDWGDRVAQSLNNLTRAADCIDLWTRRAAPRHRRHSTTMMTPWFRVGGGTPTITVPDWATSRSSPTDLPASSTIRPPSPAATSYLLQADVGPIQGRLIRRHRPAAAGSACQWTDQYPRRRGRSKADRSIRVEANAVEGVRQRPVGLFDIRHRRVHQLLPGDRLVPGAVMMYRPYVTDLPARKDLCVLHQLGQDGRRRLAGVRRGHPGPGRIRRTHIGVRRAGHRVRPGHR